MRKRLQAVGNEIALQPPCPAWTETDVQTVEQIGALALRDLTNPATLVLVLMEGAGRIAEHFFVQLFRQHESPTITGHLCKNFQQQPPPTRRRTRTPQPLGGLPRPLRPITSGEFGNRQKQSPKIGRPVIEASRE